MQRASLRVTDRRIDELDIAGARCGPRSPTHPDKDVPTSVHRVSFAYRPDQPVLHEVSFSVPPTSQTAIVGPSGAGKTTLFALLERFYDPCGGTIELCGTPIANIPRAVSRARIGYVEQEAPVLAGTLRENLLYAATDASDEALAAVIEEAQLGECEEHARRSANETAIAADAVRWRAPAIAIARALLRVRPAAARRGDGAARCRQRARVRETIERAPATAQCW